MRQSVHRPAPPAAPAPRACTIQDWGASLPSRHRRDHETMADLDKPAPCDLAKSISATTIGTHDRGRLMRVREKPKSA
jgi:hypothetical protein